MELKEYVAAIQNEYADKYATQELEVHFTPVGVAKEDDITFKDTFKVTMRPYLSQEEYMTLVNTIAMAYFTIDYNEETDVKTIKTYQTSYHNVAEFESMLEFMTDINTDDLKDEEIAFLYWNTDLYEQMIDILSHTTLSVARTQYQQLQDDVWDMVQHYKDLIIHGQNASDEVVSASAQMYLSVLNMMDKIEDFIAKCSDTLIVDGKLDADALSSLLGGITNSPSFTRLLRQWLFDDTEKDAKESGSKEKGEKAKANAKGKKNK